jgi:hypothetical protein
MKDSTLKIGWQILEPTPMSLLTLPTLKNPSLLMEQQPWENAMEADLSIKHFGSSLVHCKSSSIPPLLLKDILHCPNASTNLLSINKFCIDNNWWFALTGSSYSLQDNLTGAMLLRGPSENGLYPIPLLSFNSKSSINGKVSQLILE